MTSETPGSLPPSGSSGPDEVERLRAENDRLRAELDVGESRRPGRFRSIGAGVLAFLAALLLVIGVVAQWTRSTALNTDKFVARITPVIDQPQVRAEISTQLSNEIVSTLDLNTRIAAALPQNIKFLAGPISSAAEGLVSKTVTQVVDSNAFKQAFTAALRVSQESMVKALTGSGQHYKVINGKIYIDLITVVDQVLQHVQGQLPTIFGFNLSQVVPNTLPTDQIRSALQKYLGVTLSPTFGMFPIMDASALQTAKRGYRILNLSPLLVLLASLILFVCSLWVSRRRRRTLGQFALWVALLTAATAFAIRQVRDQVLTGISDPDLRGAASAAVTVLFATLREIATVIFWTAVVVALVCYLLGPGTFPRWVRGHLATAWDWTRERTIAVVSSEGLAAWTRAHLDPLRIGGIVLAAVILLIWASWAALIVIAVLLALYEIGVTLLAAPTRTPPETAAVGPPPT
jgi:hypothetical protein